ncbi:hypothetical protein Acor_43140 [Acrocarpospora corrugata]|uniref:Uncharacterized protein n=1 Tax=Acrocarpospora corrugata TaxID=35763 RepID=A0A5M3W1T6_9ACTN|nr:hypothetical protein [Acrocarpospora corrugata]GES02249.1 hypothetical protein Acor_43140 [Acrocarpospora corrugata]
MSKNPWLPRGTNKKALLPRHTLTSKSPDQPKSLDRAASQDQLFGTSKSPWFGPDRANESVEAVDRLSALRDSDRHRPDADALAAAGGRGRPAGHVDVGVEGEGQACCSQKARQAEDMRTSDFRLLPSWFGSVRLTVAVILTAGSVAIVIVRAESVGAR